MICVFRQDGNRPYGESANKGYRGLRLKDAEMIGVVVESRRVHRK